MNTVTIAPAKPSVNWRVNAPATDPMVAFEQFRLGYDRYVAGDSYFECASAEQRRGYLAANRAEAAATLPATSADRLAF